MLTIYYLCLWSLMLSIKQINEYEFDSKMLHVFCPITMLYTFDSHTH